MATHTGFIAGVLALVYVLLALDVIRHRRRARVGLGTGDDEALLRSVRIHGNFAEYVPLALVMLALVELNGFDTRLVDAAGGALVVARLLHALGLKRSRNTSVPRFVGTALTFTILCGLAALLFLGRRGA